MAARYRHDHDHPYFLYNIADPNRKDFADRALSELLPLENKGKALEYLAEQLQRPVGKKEPTKTAEQLEAEKHVVGREIGEPLPTKTYTTEQLIEMGYVGLYIRPMVHEPCISPEEFRARANKWRQDWDEMIAARIADGANVAGPESGTGGINEA